MGWNYDIGLASSVGYCDILKMEKALNVMPEKENIESLLTGGFANGQ